MKRLANRHAALFLPLNLSVSMVTVRMLYRSTAAAIIEADG